MTTHRVVLTQTVALFLLLLLMPLLARPALLDIAPNGPVNATAVGADGTLYLGGEFTRMETKTGGGAVLDGRTGAVDRQFPAIEGHVNASVSDGSGGWYIGGDFTQVDGVARANLAHILGTGKLDLNWNPGANGPVNVLAISGSTLYAGGTFTQVGGRPRVALAAIAASGATTDWNPHADGAVRALVIEDGTVYVGGDFTTMGVDRLMRNRLAAIAASGSGAATNWNPQANGTVNALASFGTKIFVGGKFSQISGKSRNGLAVIGTDGKLNDWHPCKNDNQNSIFTFATSNNGPLWVGGDFTCTDHSTTRKNLGLINKDNPAWLNAMTGAPANGPVTALAVAGSNSYAYVGGLFTHINGIPRTGLAAVDTSGSPTDWNPVTDGCSMTSLSWCVMALAFSTDGTKIYAGGNFKTAGYSRNRLAAIAPDGTLTRWNPDANGSVNALAVIGSTVYAGGDFTAINTVPRDRLAAVGTNGALTGWNPGANASVRALAVTGSTVYAGGDFTAINTVPRDRLAAIGANGRPTSWNIGADKPVNALAVSGSMLYAGGDFSSVGGRSRSALAAIGINSGVTDWDPHVAGRVNALATSGSMVYAGGKFNSVGKTKKTYYSNLALIDTDGTVADHWKLGANGTVSALTVSNSVLYAGGKFTEINGLSRRYLAAIYSDGTLADWTPEPSASVRTLTTSGSTVYAGGEFHSVAQFRQDTSPGVYYSALSTPILRATANPPAAPTIVSVSAGNAQATVGWKAPGQTGGAPITGYRVIASPGPATCMASATETTCTLTGLNNGTRYTFTVAAKNSAGFGPDSARSSPVTLAAVPDAVAWLQATPGNAEVYVSWQAVYMGGGSWGRYTVTSSPGGKTCITGDVGCLIQGLSNGTPYTFTIVATNNVGDSFPTTSDRVTPATVPGAPLSVFASRGDAEATVRWFAPDSGGAAIDFYRVIASPGGRMCISSFTECTVPGLTNGTDYTFTVIATNSMGEGATSIESNRVTPAGGPGAPTAVTATRGNTQASIRWTPPADTGGAAINGYTVIASPGGFICQAGGAATTCTVTGLSNGTRYTFAVSATNSQGTGPATTSNEVTPATVPGAPTAVTATRGNTEASIRWTAPADTGGAAITGFTVESSRDARTCTATPPATTCTVTGLTNGTSYAFRVTANNEVGSGPASGASAPVIPATAPGAPTDIAITRGNTEVTIRWTAPTDTGGTAISGYSVTSSPGAKTCAATAPTTTCTITGLTNGTPYSFTVTASNSAGTSRGTTSNTVTPATVPGAPSVVSAIAGSSEATLRWTVPNTGGEAIIRYTVTTVENSSKTCTAIAPTVTCTVSGLTNGTPYTFTVSATNAVGTGSHSTASSPVTPATVPGAPTATGAVAGNATATLSWTAPTDTGGAEISGYSVTASPGGKTCSTSTTTCTVTGLSNGTAYTFTITASNRAGTGPASEASDAVTPATLPGAPTPGAVISGNGEAAVSWSAPADNGGATITGYRVTASPDSMTCTAIAPSTHCTVTGLSNGTAYTFTITATNWAGTGPASEASSSVTPATVPDAPTAVVAIAHNAGATVSWTAPADTGGAAISNYHVTAVEDTGKTCTTVAPATSCTVTGLGNGTAYTFTVTATNRAGTGPASLASSAATPATVPDAPMEVAATPGNAGATLGWAPPTFNGGGAIIRYTVTTVEDTGKTCTTVAPATTCIITGLGNGTAYTFTVTATNWAGTGSPSAASRPITPATAPGVPADVFATRGNTQASIGWAAPTDTGGAAISGYTVTTVEDSGKTCTAIAPATTCTVTGLSNGTAYRFTVTATNWAGTGSPSAASLPVTPATVPGAPTAVAATRGNTQVGLRWTAPTDTGGAAISNYTVSTVEDASAICTAIAPATTCIVSGLNNGTAYTFTVTATNSAGTGLPSAASGPVTPTTVPGTPTAVSGIRGSTQATIGWTAPTETGSTSISGYTVTTVEDSRRTCIAIAPATTCTVTGLGNGTAYTFTVTATNSVGSGLVSAASPPVIPATVPGAPTAVTATAGNAETAIRWTAPVSSGGTAITGYSVTATPSGRTCTTPAAVTRCVITGLNNGTAYSFTVTATNDVGNGPASGASSPVTPATLPGAPGNVSATRGNLQAILRWTAPTDHGGAAMTGYTVTAVEDSSKICTASAQATSCTIERLTNGTVYTFAVSATNSLGTGPATISNTVTPATVPGTPTAVTVTRGNAEVTVVWTAPADAGGAEISGYRVTALPGGQTCTASAPETRCTVTGLSNGSPYRFAIVAINAAGVSPDALSNPVTPATVPGTPAAVTATGGNAESTINWRAPADAGGLAITRYTVTASPEGQRCAAIAPATTCIVSGLNNGTAYTFTVTATNPAGTGLASAASQPVTPATVPGAPLAVTAIGGSTEATLRWTAADSGGAAISSYTVTSVEDTSRTCTAIPPTTACTVTGLTNGRTYTFIVSATNSLGTGPYSTASNPVTPATVPGAPTAVFASRGNAEATLRWSAPTNIGAAPIGRYTVTSSPEGKTCTAVAPATTCTVTGLTNGSPYTFTVTATSAAGTGAASVASSSVTPATVAGAPTAVAAIGSNAAATVSWTPPAATGGAAISGYTVITVEDTSKTCTASAPATTCTVPGLSNGNAYTFTVAATNGAGSGPASTMSNSVTPATVPGAPTAVAAIGGNAAAIVSWTPPAMTGGSAVTRYTVTTTGDTGKTCTASAPATTCSVTGLSNGTAYTFTVAATNGAGTGPVSAVSSPVTPATVPGIPTAVSAIGGNGAATVSWTPPATTGGAAIGGYTVTSVEDTAKTCTASVPAITCTVSGLSNGTAYTFTVTAANPAGTGLSSAASHAVTPAAAPGAPTAVSAIGGNGAATVSWTPPATTGGAAIDGYTVTTVEDIGKTCSVVAPATRCTVTGLSNGIAYTFTVTAANRVGTGPASAPGRPVTLATVPGAPTAVAAISGDAAATVNWTSPTETGSTAISGYTVTAVEDTSKTCTAIAPATTCTVTGLSNRTAYTFTVTATNSVGAGLASTASNPVTPTTTPAAPTAVSAISGNTQAIVRWLAPADSGGAAISSYTVTTVEDSRRTCTAIAPELSCSVSGLTNGIAYTFTVTATNPAGTGLTSVASSPVTPATVPGAPTALAATAGNAEALLGWSPPTSTGGGAITGYRVTASPGGQICSAIAPATRCTVTGLSNGIAYTFTVSATNPAGTGPASAASRPVTPVTVPAAPTALSAIRGNAQATLRWSAPAQNGGAAISGYSVSTVEDSRMICTAVAPATTCTVTGLGNGTAYRFTVAASNSVGTGPASTPSSAVTPATVPGTPMDVSALAGDGEVTLRWTAPADTGGAAIGGYFVTSLEDTGKTCSAIAPATTCSVTGLSNGTAYTFTVAATNGAGTGLASAASRPVTPAGAPGAPTAVAAAAGDAAASIRWTAPASTGGIAITRYTATAVEDMGRTCTALAPATTCSVTGLTNGTPYSFTVTATNPMGTGPASVASPAITSGPPGTPGTPLGAPGDGQVSVSWRQARTGGDPVAYTVTAVEDSSKSCTVPFPGHAFATTGCSVMGLGNGVSYRFVVTAENDAGSTRSEPSAPVQPEGRMEGVCGRAVDTPTLVKPSGFLCSTGEPTPVASDQGAFSWSCQGSRGGSSALCQVSGALNNAGGTTAFVTPKVEEGGCIIQQASLIPAPDGGPNGVDMPFGLVDFQSGACQGSHAVVMLTYSQNIEGMAFFKFINNQWIELTAENSALEIRGNTVSFRVEDNGPFDANPVKGLITDPAGPGRAAATPTLPPGQPLNPVADADDTRATVTWEKPTSGGTPLRYTVSASPGGRQCTSQAEQTRCSVTGLTNGVTYSFTVVAENEGGDGSPSLPSNAVTPMTPVTVDSGTDQALCGPAQAIPTLQPPKTGLCAIGEPDAVLAENGGFSWRCQLGAAASASLCRAPGARLSGGGSVSFELQPGSGCAVESAQLSAPSVTTPQGGSLPFGVAGFRLTHCSAPIATVNMSVSESVTGMTLWHWLRQTWTPLPTAVLSGKTVRFSIEDNGPYDANPLAGEIENAVGPGGANGKAGQPALSLRLRKNTLRSGQFATLNVRGGRGRGKISFSTQSSGGAQCRVSRMGHNPLLLVRSKTSGASCSVWAIKDGDKAYNATVSNSMTVRVSVGGR